MCKWRLSLFNDISLRESLLQGSSSPVLRIYEYCSLFHAFHTPIKLYTLAIPKLFLHFDWFLPMIYQRCFKMVESFECLDNMSCNLAEMIRYKKS